MHPQLINYTHQQVQALLTARYNTPEEQQLIRDTNSATPSAARKALPKLGTATSAATTAPPGPAPMLVRCVAEPSFRSYSRG
jgi:hypothetical protein